MLELLSAVICLSTSGWVNPLIPPCLHSSVRKMVLQMWDCPGYTYTAWKSKLQTTEDRTSCGSLPTFRTISPPPKTASSTDEAWKLLILGGSERPVLAALNPSWTGLCLKGSLNNLSVTSHWIHQYFLLAFSDLRLPILYFYEVPVIKSWCKLCTEDICRKI